MRRRRQFEHVNTRSHEWVYLQRRFGEFPATKSTKVISDQFNFISRSSEPWRFSEKPLIRERLSMQLPRWRRRKNSWFVIIPNRDRQQYHYYVAYSLTVSSAHVRMTLSFFYPHAYRTFVKMRERKCFRRVCLQKTVQKANSQLFSFRRFIVATSAATEKRERDLTLLRSADV